MHELFRFRFGAGNNSAASPSGIPVFMPVLSGSDGDEIWESNEVAEHGFKNDFIYARSNSLLMLHTSIRDDAGNLEAITHAAYVKLLEESHRHGYKDVLRTWNYLPDINAGAGDSERYRQFAAGRSKAFEQQGFEIDNLPAGTAIGTAAGTPLSITLLCSTNPAERIENPRQVSAYKYPRQYGPRSPSFSRAVLMGANQPVLLISGTASILGHETVHTDDLANQTKETVANISVLKDTTEAQAKLTAADSQGCLRLYVRNASDLEEVLENLQPLLNDGSHLVALQGDICRSDLLLEVEAVYLERSL